MALADLVLEGLTLILVIALGLVLIGGLAYLTMTVTSANNARLAYVGLYIYLPQPFYANGTLYVPMLNIGYYKALVRYVYVRAADGSMHVYAPDLVLSPNQYYVYRLNLDYEPSSVTVVVSPVDYPSVVREFSVNVSEVTTVPIMTLSGPGSSSGLIKVVVNDPYNAGWSVTWSYAGQSFSMGQSQSYTWWLNPPYVPIQISFQASITQNPTGYACQIQPSSITNTYGPGSIQEFNVTCSLAPITVTVTDSYGAGWNITWSGAASGSKSGSSSTSWTINPTSNNTVSFTASITSVPSGYSSCTITPQTTSALPGQSVTFTVSCSGGTSGGGGSNSYTVTVYVYAPSGVSWTTYLDEDDAGAIFYVDYWSGTGNGGPYTATVISDLTYLFSVKNLPSSCTASGSPYGIDQKFTPSGSFTEVITITCSNYQPPSTTYGCYLTTSATSSPSGIPVSVTPSGTTFLSPGQSVTVQFNAPTSQTISTTPYGEYWYQFIDWVITANPGGYTSLPTNPYTTAKTNPSVTVTCPSGLNSTVNIQVSGTANYQEDYYTVSGPTEVSQSGYYNVTLSWNLAPAFVQSVSWQVGYTSSSVNIDPIYIYASNHVYQTSWYITPSVSCPSGYVPIIAGVSPTGTITQNIGDETSGSTSITLDITVSCQLNTKLG